MAISLEFQKYESRLCIPLPLYHCYAMVLGRLTHLKGFIFYINWNETDFCFSLVTICHGSTAVFPSKSFNAEASLKAIQNEK